MLSAPINPTSKNINTAKRFFDKMQVDKKSGCWLWTAHQGRGDYGQFYMNRRDWRAHRASWVLFVGKIPDNLQVLHKCDNPPCVNPDHLFVGSNLDNRLDCKNKGRQSKGSKSHYSKLAESDIKIIREMYKKGVCLQPDIARIFNMSVATISRIIARKIWQHVE